MKQRQAILALWDLAEEADLDVVRSTVVDTVVPERAGLVSPVRIV